MDWKYIFVVFAAAIINHVVTNPENEQAVYKQEHCIKMTPEKEAEIQLIIEKIGDCLNKIAEEHEEFDVRLVQFDIERHFEEEVDEKETTVQVNINDCSEEKQEIFTEGRSDHELRSHSEANSYAEAHSEASSNAEAHSEASSNAEAHSEASSNAEAHSEASSYAEAKRKHGVLVTLDLDDNGKAIVDKLERSRGKKINPLIVYLKEEKGQQEYWLFNK